ncbi:hypothetical protein RUND412_007884 [Rhizina undulata]
MTDLPVSECVSRRRLRNGAYVIRHRYLGYVLHCGEQALTGNRRNENLYRNQQIWWVERIPNEFNTGDSDGSGDSGELYSITNIAMGKAIEMGEGGEITAKLPHGETSQQWRISEDFSEIYTICRPVGDAELNFEYGGSESRPEYNVRCRTHGYWAWEFLLPLVAIPPGWIHIESVATGKRLNHRYLGSVVHLSAPQILSSTNRDGWGSQWAFIASGEPDDENYWLVKNRLTGGLLEAGMDLFSPAQYLYARSTTETHRTTLQHWKIELTVEGVWRISYGDQLALSHTVHRVENADVDVVQGMTSRGTRDSVTHWMIKEVGPGNVACVLRQPPRESRAAEESP